MKSGIDRRCWAEVEDAVAEFWAVGESDGVGAGEGDEILNIKVFSGENGDDFVQGHGGGGDVAFDVGCPWHEAVFPAEEDVVVRPADHGDQVAGGDGDDVGAWHGVGALELQRRFQADDEVEGVTGERSVELGVALGIGVGVGGDQQGGVAAAHDAVMEEETEDSGGGGRRRHLFIHNDSLHGGGECWACFLVVIFVQIRLRERN